MPCSDGGVPYPPTREEIIAAKMPAVLCGLITKLGIEEAIDMIDWNEAGVYPAELREWWELHQARDRARRERERVLRMREELRQQALAKLTPEERAALKGK